MPRADPRPGQRDIEGLAFDDDLEAVGGLFLHVDHELAATHADGVASHHRPPRCQLRLCRVRPAAIQREA
jgi:hypothetical protein